MADSTHAACRTQFSRARPADRNVVPSAAYRQAVGVHCGLSLALTPLPTSPRGCLHPTAPNAGPASVGFPPHGNFWTSINPTSPPIRTGGRFRQPFAASAIPTGRHPHSTEAGAAEPWPWGGPRLPRKRSRTGQRGGPPSAFETADWQQRRWRLVRGRRPHRLCAPPLAPCERDSPPPQASHGIERGSGRDAKLNGRLSITTGCD